MFLRWLRWASVCELAASLVLQACGSSSLNSDGASGGSEGVNHGGSAGKSSGGAGKPAVADAVPCGKNTCKGLTLGLQQSFDIPGCCADPDTSSCGLDSSGLAMFGPSLGMACQPLAQPGKLDPACPESAAAPVTGTPIPIKFPGCCQANGFCGYQLDSIAGGLIQIGLGCVDSAPFLDGGTPRSCGAGPAVQGDGGASAGGG